MWIRTLPNVQRATGVHVTAEDLCRLEIPKTLLSDSLADDADAWASVDPRLRRAVANVDQVLLRYCVAQLFDEVDRATILVEHDDRYELVFNVHGPDSTAFAEMTWAYFRANSPEWIRAKLLALAERGGYREDDE